MWLAAYVVESATVLLCLNQTQLQGRQHTCKTHSAFVEAFAIDAFVIGHGSVRISAETAAAALADHAAMHMCQTL